MIRQALISYIIGVNNCNELIIGIFSMFGYREDPRLQDIIQLMVTMGSQSFTYKLPDFASEQIEYMRKHPNNSLFRKYGDLYNILVTYNFFLGEEYQGKDVDLDEIHLDEPIDRIINVMKE
ncbi:MAG: hypothetical protein NC131_11110 [Roseburia sp.]|nr:hypothetical protein [Roseburia sp.]